jgi:RNA polymerase sigma-70 factor (ECF subfamily)
MWSDGGGKASAARRPLLGRDEVLNFLIGLHRTGQTTGLARQASLSIEDVNSEAALVLRIAGHLESIFVFSVEDDRISGIRVVRNPDKLARIDRKLAVG